MRNTSLLELNVNPPDGILAGPVSDENFFEWEALITLVLPKHDRQEKSFCF